jgi:hypothetical protein
MRNLTTIAFATMLAFVAAPGHAGDADNIRACQAAVQAKNGLVVDEFAASVKRRVLQTSFVTWPGIVCEVGSGQVRKLTINGAPVVENGWPSPEAKATYDALAQETASAIGTLEARRALLAQRLRGAESALRQPGTDALQISTGLRDDIANALGD